MDWNAEIVRMCKALSEPNRIKLLDKLSTEESCERICLLAKALKKDSSVIYRHIQILQEAGLVETHKEKQSLYCCATPVARRIITFLNLEIMNGREGKRRSDTKRQRGDMND